MKQQSRNQQLPNRSRFEFDLRGPYVFDEVDSRHVRCALQFNDTEVAISIPAEVLRQHRLLGESSTVTLCVSGERSAPINFRPVLSSIQRKSAARWSAEMGDFDRF